MNEFREELLIKLSIPIYAIVIGIEILYSYWHEKKYYSTKGLLANIYLTTLNFSLDILVRGVCLGVLWYFQRFEIAAIDKSVYPVLYWTALLFAEDFLFYWMHRVDHYCRLFWAVHVTHHSSEEFNLTVGFRSSVFQPLYRFVYFIPLSLFGFDPLDVMFMYAATQIYGILIHTKTVGKLGFLEWFLSTPSHHRVHHASNIKYLDKNMGMIFIIWDRIFGTFEEEKEEVIYGLTTNLTSYNPITMVFHEWHAIFSDLKKETSLKNKLLYVFGPPGWSHDGSRKTSRQLRDELNNNK
ncbi:MAG: fatty acid hydroxylase [Bacteroidota bacterium]|jgi:sterol desaturase/sphingolipid hydroxylase (fatty acid hydroxylase superfamily)|nr:fatty acid hydroxylase [Bacteroidota bacterium]